MDNKATTKRMIGAVVLVLVAALLLAWLLKGKNRESQEQMAMDQAGETQPILGFPDMANPDQKPSVVGEDQATAQTAQQDNTPNQDNGQGSVVENAANAVKDAAGNAISSVSVNTVSDTTGFSLRPSTNNETRQAVDQNGKLVNTAGSMGASANPNTTQKQSGNSASSKDVSRNTTQEKDNQSVPRPVLVNERRVPAPVSVESKAKAAQKTAADKAAEAKSLELAKRNAATSAPDSYAVQVLASSSKGKADAAAAPLRADGYQVTVTAAKVDGKTVYRVLVGNYADKVAATAVQTKMKARYTQNSGVQHSFITSGK